VIPYTFAQDGEYDIQIYLARGYSGDVDGLKDPQPHEIKLLLDRTPIGEFTVQRPANGDDSLIDRNLKIRVPVTAGPHQLGVTFLKNSSSLIETGRQPLQSRFNERRSPRITPAISQVSVTGPYEPQGGQHAEPPPDISSAGPPSPKAPAGRLRLRQRLRRDRPLNGRRDSVRARILSTLMRRAYVDRFPRRIWNGRWRSIAKESRNATSTRE
jgi:hypothetical protein